MTLTRKSIAGRNRRVSPPWQAKCLKIWFTPNQVTALCLPGQVRWSRTHLAYYFSSCLQGTMATTSIPSFTNTWQGPSRSPSVETSSLADGVTTALAIALYWLQITSMLSFTWLKLAMALSPFNFGDWNSEVRISLLSEVVGSQSFELIIMGSFNKKSPLKRKNGMPVLQNEN